jgi:hypothetical protein
MKTAGGGVHNARGWNQSKKGGLFGTVNASNQDSLVSSGRKFQLRNIGFDADGRATH